MQLTGKITDVRPQGPRRTKSGHDVNAYYLSIESDPPIPDGYLQAKSYEPTVGEEITVEVDNPGEKGCYLKRVTDYQGGGSGGGTSNPDREKRITRQHSQEMALRALTILGSPTTPAEGQTVGDAFRAEIRRWADWFDADAFSTSGRPAGDSSATPNDTSANGSSPPAASSPAAGVAAAQGTDSGSQTLTDDDSIPF